MSRKCISIYLYTKERPSEEVVPKHGTFYVQRPLPSHIAEGRTLSSDDLTEIKRLIQRRDDWITLYQTLELRKQSEIESLSKRLNERIAELSQLAKQQNDEVELRGALLDQKRKELADERNISSELRGVLLQKEREIELLRRTPRPQQTS